MRLAPALPAAFWTTARTRFQALTYSAGLFLLTVPDHAYQGVLGSGIGRKRTSVLSEAICLASVPRPLSRPPRAITASRNLGLLVPFEPLSGSQLHDRAELALLDERHRLGVDRLARRDVEVDGRDPGADGARQRRAGSGPGCPGRPRRRRRPGRSGRPRGAPRRPPGRERWPADGTASGARGEFSGRGRRARTGLYARPEGRETPPRPFEQIPNPPRHAAMTNGRHPPCARARDGRRAPRRPSQLPTAKPAPRRG